MVGQQTGRAGMDSKISIDHLKENPKEANQNRA
jgi:hypothetical protein